LQRANLPSAPGVPLIGIVSRLAGQKGFDLFPAALPRLLERHRAQLIVTGTGERHFERMFRQLAAKFPTQVRFHNAFSNEMAHWIEAGSDFFLMPSRYEPCGLNQMYSLKYGTVPIVRKTGGLADTVQPWNARTSKGTGIVFETYDAFGLYWALTEALRTWHDRPAYLRLQQNGMAEDFSWDHQVEKYEHLYRQL
jgi:starch synthase